MRITKQAFAFAFCQKSESSSHPKRGPCGMSHLLPDCGRNTNLWVCSWLYLPCPPSQLYFAVQADLHCQPQLWLCTKTPVLKTLDCHFLENYPNEKSILWWLWWEGTPWLQSSSCCDKGELCHTNKGCSWIVQGRAPGEAQLQAAGAEMPITGWSLPASQRTDCLSYYFHSRNYPSLFPVICIIPSHWVFFLPPQNPKWPISVSPVLAAGDREEEQAGLPGCAHWLLVTKGVIILMTKRDSSLCKITHFWVLPSLIL